MVRHVYILVLLTALLSACSDSTTTSTNTGNSGNGLTGTLKGVVKLYDSNAVALTDNSGLRVELLGTPYSAVTDAAGVWTIADLPTRTYNISFSKSGYPTVKMQREFLGGATVWIGNYSSPAYFIQTPVFTITLDGVFPPTGVYLNGGIFGHFSKNTPDYNLSHGHFSYVIAVGHSPEIDISDATTYTSIINESTGSGFKRFTPDTVISFGATTYGTYGFASGETMYIRAYPIPGLYLEYYYDPETGRIVYWNVGEGSNVLSVVIP